MLEGALPGDDPGIKDRAHAPLKCWSPRYRPGGMGRGGDDRWITLCHRVPRARGLPATGHCVRRWVEGKAPASFYFITRPKFSSSQEHPQDLRPRGEQRGGEQGQNGEASLRPRGRAGGRAESARGPGRGGRAPAECGSAWPRSRPRPAASAPGSPLCPPAGRAQASEPAGLS